MAISGHPAVHFPWAAWYSGTMDSGWTMGACDKSEPERALLIRSKTFFNKITFGCVSRLLDDAEPGFWFVVIQGTQFRLTGKW